MNEEKVKCSACKGSCCDGTLFKQVALTSKEAKRLQAMGGRVERVVPFSDMILNIRGGCQFLKEGRCSIYGQRPQACRDWTCSFEKPAGEYRNATIDIESLF